MKPDDRLREMILYVADKSTADDNFGSVKLNKILYFADFTAFAVIGRPITGAEYVRREHGPCPRKLKDVRGSLVRDGSAVIQKRQCHTYTQDRVVPLRKPDLGGFSAEEIEIVHDVLERLRSVNGSQASEISHTRAWRVAGPDETIPYEAVFVSDRNATTADTAETEALAAANGWTR